jgi:hypothetical protein
MESYLRRRGSYTGNGGTHQLKDTEDNDTVTYKCTVHDLGHTTKATTALINSM